MKFNILSCLILVFMLATLSSCEEEIRPVGLDTQQLVAGRFDGTWAKPSLIKTPENVPADVFGDMRLTFTTDESGYPAQFLAKDCPIIFEGLEGKWSVNGSESDATIKLTGITPVDEFKAVVTGTSLTLTFHMGWENTDTGEQGRGDFKVTLARQ